MKIPSQTVLCDLFDYNSSTGKLFWKTEKAYKINVGDEAGWITDRGYRYVQIDGQTFPVHRIIWVIVHGVEPDEIDHINGKKLDNRIVNLRSVSHTENTKNLTRPLRNTSGFIGVSWHKPLNKWRVQTSIDGKKKHLGYFDNIVDAVRCKKNSDIKNGYHINHGRAYA